MENRKVLSDKTVGLKPSGIRKFFDLVSEMKDGISATRVSIHWRRAVPFIRPIPV